ncbi:uncharacterized protein F5147DRAFT_649203 [Suillus discolor]|uniref:Uncharacterized protein n=1 Tax=Suillus discolor TaxID=1912936 RepID=A0A9P7FEV7_9AGAM|nr:uncharacterized protein F5147DRAFT_649203 [Suillus discolor]KAG2115728.1 hypothetical protein F5147DRAFT_649203 [Suillus discolor]
MFGCISTRLSGSDYGSCSQVKLTQTSSRQATVTSSARTSSQAYSFGDSFCLRRHERIINPFLVLNPARINTRAAASCTQANMPFQAPAEGLFGTWIEVLPTLKLIVTVPSAKRLDRPVAVCSVYINKIHAPNPDTDNFNINICMHADPFIHCKVDFERAEVAKASRQQRQKFITSAMTTMGSTISAAPENAGQMLEGLANVFYHYVPPTVPMTSQVSLPQPYVQLSSFQAPWQAPLTLMPFQPPLAPPLPSPSPQPLPPSILPILPILSPSPILPPYESPPSPILSPSPSWPILPPPPPLSPSFPYQIMWQDPETTPACSGSASIWQWAREPALGSEFNLDELVAKLNLVWDVRNQTFWEQFTQDVDGWIGSSGNARYIRGTRDKHSQIQRAAAPWEVEAYYKWSTVCFAKHAQLNNLSLSPEAT